MQAELTDQTIHNLGVIERQININHVEHLIIHSNGHQVPFLAPPLPPYKLIGREKLLR